MAMHQTCRDVPISTPTDAFQSPNVDTFGKILEQGDLHIANVACVADGGSPVSQLYILLFVS